MQLSYDLSTWALLCFAIFSIFLLSNLGRYASQAVASHSYHSWFKNLCSTFYHNIAWYSRYICWILWLYLKRVYSCVACRWFDPNCWQRASKKYGKIEVDDAIGEKVQTLRPIQIYPVANFNITGIYFRTECGTSLLCIINYAFHPRNQCSPAWFSTGLLVWRH